MRGSYAQQACSQRSCSFIALHNTIYPRAVTEFAYRYEGPTRAHIYMSFIAENALDRVAEVKALIEQLAGMGMRAIDISDNEMAKSHARYLIGGRQRVLDERVFRFGA